MKRFRHPYWVLIAMFLTTIAVVPAIQTIIEIHEGNGVKALQIFNALPTSANLRAFEKELERGNWAGRLARPWMQFAQFEMLKDGGEKVVLGDSGWYFYKPGLKYMLARAKNGQALTANDPVAAIVNFRDQLEAQGIHLLVMPVPNKESIYPDRLTSRASNLRTVVTPRTREVLKGLRAAKVEMVDLFQEFDEKRRENDGTNGSLYLAQDTHWSPRGLSLAAKAVARRLTELGWIQPGRIEYSERATPVQRIGDILRMMQSPLIERRIKPEIITCNQVLHCANGQPYKDEAEAEILVLGDSFMRIFQEDEPTGAGFIAHLSKELKQPMMSLVNDGGGSTLVREELCARPVFLKRKKVVVWEFVERDIGMGIKGWQRTDLPVILKAR